MPRKTPSAGVPASVFRVSRPSTVDLIATELRAAIHSGALPVGSQLGEVEIAGQLGVSRSPLREASQRLLQEGLLTALPGRGLRVSVIGADFVSDVYEARIAIEAQAVRRITGRGDSATLTELERRFDELVEATDGAEARAIGDADLTFHRVLVDAAGSRRLSQSMATLVIETRIASFSTPDGYAVPAAVSPTYREILDALAARDPDRAIAALERQFEDAVSRLTGADEIETVETPADEEPPSFNPIEQIIPSVT